ncbi:MAG TPA: hypothetical protein VEI02_03555 [Planctomycetota bacterium]|nr:hypothetical protein [Planctomycetota bacterium]
MPSPEAAGSSAPRGRTALILAFAVALGGAALPLAFEHRAADAFGFPRISLRPYLGGDRADVPPIPGRGRTPYVACAAVGAAALAAYAAGFLWTRRVGLKAHAPAAAAAVALWLVAPGWASWIRLDVPPPGGAEARDEVDAALGGAGGRVRAGLRAWAEAPSLAYATDPRLDVATGHEGLLPSTRLFAGLAGHALAMGAAMMLAGVRRAAASVAASAAIAVGLAVFTPEYVPGSPRAAVATLAPYVPTLAVALSVAGTPAARAALAGFALGALALASLAARDRAPWLAERAAALRLPRIGVEQRPDLERETDPARLALFALDMPATEPGVVGAAIRARRLLDAGAPCLAPRRLSALVAGLAIRMPAAGLAPGAQDPKYFAVAEKLERDLADLRALGERPRDAAYRAIVHKLTETSVPVDLAQLRDLSPDDPRTRRLLDAFGRIMEHYAEATATVGDLRESVALREAALDLGLKAGLAVEEEALARTRIGALLVQAGDFERGGAEIRAFAPKADLSHLPDALLKGWAGVASAALGDRKAALAALQETWSDVGGRYRDPAQGLTPDRFDYWYLVEFLHLRLTLARELDPPLAPQAERDFMQAVRSAAAYGVRRLPALLFGAHAAALEGRVDEARDLLREGRRLPFAVPADRAGGALGRMTTPRYRRMALERLRDLLEGPEHAAERADVERELSAF